MSHLNLETLARLVDESPDPTEAGHLDICEQCRTELEALRADASALRYLPDPEPPIIAWLTLEERLKREGLMRRTPWRATVVRMAAVFIIFVLGSVVGGMLIRHRDVRLATSTPAVTNPIQQTTAPSTAFTAESSHTPSSPAVAMASLPLNSAAARPAATPQEAAVALRDAEKAYLSALARYSDFTSKSETADPLARLAALESIVATTRAALGQAPADPVINGYHLTAVAQRDATLRQLAASGQTWY